MDWELFYGSLSPELREKVSALGVAERCGLEEIRLRVGQPVRLQYQGYDRDLLWDDKPCICSAELLRRCLQVMTGSSLYAYAEELRHGFITLPGGHRVGLAGEAVVENGSIKTLKNFCGLNIRLARAVPGASDSVLPFVIRDGKLVSALIMAPPGVGKTTVLRDMACSLSEGRLLPRTYKICLIDERRELAAAFSGVPQLPVGSRTDVLSGCTKSDGMLLALRSLSPEILITDEIGMAQDALACKEAAAAGVCVIASAHGSGPASVKARAGLKELFANEVFERLIVLERQDNMIRAAAVYEAEGLIQCLNSSEQC